SGRFATIPSKSCSTARANNAPLSSDALNQLQTRTRRDVGSEPCLALDKRSITHIVALVVSANVQGRGFELERAMYDLFELFDLDPKASFRNTGEQIDGAFSFEGTEYLFEAKWQQELVNAADLDSFGSKVRRKLENTLGVFLSINGFSQDGVAAHSAG